MLQRNEFPPRRHRCLQHVANVKLAAAAAAAVAAPVGMDRP